MELHIEPNPPVTLEARDVDRLATLLRLSDEVAKSAAEKLVSASQVKPPSVKLAAGEDEALLRAIEEQQRQTPGDFGKALQQLSRYLKGKLDREP